MGMDRNTIIGFALIGALLIGMFIINSKSRLAYEGEKARIADSIERSKPKADPTLARADSLRADSMRRVAGAQTALQGVEKEEQSVLENELMKISFTNKGAQPVTVELKKFKKLDGAPVFLQSGNFNKLSYSFNSANNQTAESGNVYFKLNPVVRRADNSQVLEYSIADSSGKKISHVYTLRPNDYRLDLDIVVTGPGFFTQNEMNILWQTEAPQIEQDFAYEATQTHVCYFENGDYDFEYVGTSGDDLNFSKPTNWIALKQQFFASALIAKSKFKSAKSV